MESISDTPSNGERQAWILHGSVDLDELERGVSHTSTIKVSANGDNSGIALVSVYREPLITISPRALFFGQLNSLPSSKHILIRHSGDNDRLQEAVFEHSFGEGLTMSIEKIHGQLCRVTATLDPSVLRLMKTENAEEHQTQIKGAVELRLLDMQPVKIPLYASNKNL